MANSEQTNLPPANYVRLEGSEKQPSPIAKLIGLADAAESFSVTMIVRRKTEGPSLPDLTSFSTTKSGKRRQLSREEFALRHGADQADMARVIEFARAYGLAITETSAASRSVTVSGTTEQMNKAFGIVLQKYEVEHPADDRNTSSRMEIYRSHAGSAHIPAALEGIVEAVIGLDNRELPVKHFAADPPGTNPLTPQQVAQLYNFPDGTGAGQTIGIFEIVFPGTGYTASDLTLTMNAFGGGLTVPTPTDFPVDGNSNTGTSDGETVLDITVASAVAQSAGIVVYFTGTTIISIIHAFQKMIHPGAGEPVPTILSISWGLSPDDDTSFIASGDYTTMTNLFQDAANLGVTVLVSSGDTGAKYSPTYSNGQAQASYPATDPWVTACGGTTIGNIAGSGFDEYVWNDSFGVNSGATGGGVSARFPIPSYQGGVTIPLSNSNNTAGRGIPDVAGNASPNSGYQQFLGGISQGATGGTSAVAPLYAGLIARINSILGISVGFLNPVLYQYAASVCRDITAAAGPTNNTFSGITGYTAGTGWDACTGLGVINGNNLLDKLIEENFSQNIQFWVDKSTFGKNEVLDIISGGGLVQNAFWLVVEGFNLNTLGAAIPVLSGDFTALPGITILLRAADVQYELGTGNHLTPQRVRFPCDINFTSINSFPPAGSVLQELLSAAITVQGNTFTAETVFELVAGADPYFTNIDAANSNSVFWLSEDLRVFTVNAGDTPAGAPAFTSNPYTSIQNFLGYVNSNSAFTTPASGDPLNGLPGQTGYETADGSVTPLNASNQQNYNFAIARVRLRGSSGLAGQAENVRVFFRLFVAQSCDTDFQPASTYLSSPVYPALPNRPVASGTGAVDPQGNSIVTIPFFATDGSGTHDYDASVMNGNIRTITIPGGTDNTWAYFGCFLDVYDAANNSLFPGTHHCIVAQIAYDDAPIINPGSFSLSPENSDKLAQRNLQITLSGNPGPASTHRIPQTFNLRPSQPFEDKDGSLFGVPDELMIDWGNTPVGSIANIYLPQVSASKVLQLASSLYGAHSLSASDGNTIRCLAVKGVTYIPIPSAPGQTFAGLFTVDLPIGVVKGQEFNIIVRRVATASRQFNPKLNIGKFEEQPLEQLIQSWRYVTGTFQIKIPVTTEDLMLLPEENTLAILKWRLQNMSPLYRWYPVLKRYIYYISGRVDGSGGDASAVKPSPTGIAVIPPVVCPEPAPDRECECEKIKNRCTIWLAIAIVPWVAFWIFTIWAAMYLITTGAITVLGFIVLLLVFIATLWVSAALLKKALVACDGNKNK